MDKMCPFINRFNVSIKYGGYQYESNATGFEWLECQKEKCVAWGVIKEVDEFDSNAHYIGRMEIYGCKRIEKEFNNG